MRAGARICRRAVAACVTTALSLTMLACGDGREVRSTRAPGGGDALAPIETSGLQPGPARVVDRATNPYAGDANAVADGRRLYMWMNCHGCHGMLGGGGIGPPFADAEWIYGDSPAEIYQSIMQGRPNGMPSFGRLIPPDRAWTIVAYVQSISGSAGPEGEHPTERESSARESGSSEPGGGG